MPELEINYLLFTVYCLLFTVKKGNLKIQCKCIKNILVSKLVIFAFLLSGVQEPTSSYPFFYSPGFKGKQPIIFPMISNKNSLCWKIFLSFVLFAFLTFFLEV